MLFQDDGDNIPNRSLGSIHSFSHFCMEKLQHKECSSKLEFFIKAKDNLYQILAELFDFSYNNISLSVQTDYFYFTVYLRTAINVLVNFYTYNIYNIYI